jgi:hypothetical protein
MPKRSLGHFVPRSLAYCKLLRRRTMFRSMSTDEFTAVGDRRARIRRSTELPAAPRYEHAGRYKYPHRLELVADGRALTLRYRRSKLGYLLGYDAGFVRKRELFCWLFEGRIRIGAVHFIEWDIDPFANKTDFLFEMDSHEQITGELAVVISSAWKLAELVDHGRLLEFRTAWMMPGRQPGAWLHAAELLMDRVYRDDASVLVLKAFPLEYEGSNPKESGLDAALERRQSAMKRHYVRCLRVEPMPGDFGRDGWMWRALSAGVPKPAARKCRW